MSTFEQKDMTGSLWPNDNPRSEKSPQFTGTCVIEGKKYKFSGFKNETKEGRKYIGTTFQPFEEDAGSKFTSKSKDDDGWL
jgi:hypothetical protein